MEGSCEEDIMVSQWYPAVAATFPHLAWEGSTLMCYCPCTYVCTYVCNVCTYLFQCFICRCLHTTVLQCSLSTPSHVCTYVRSLEYIEDESLLLSSSHDGCVRLWNTNGQFIGVCMRGACHQRGIFFSPCCTLMYYIGMHE